MNHFSDPAQVRENGRLEISGRDEPSIPTLTCAQCRWFLPGKAGEGHCDSSRSEWFWQLCQADDVACEVGEATDE